MAGSLVRKLDIGLKVSVATFVIMQNDMFNFSLQRLPRNLRVILKWKSWSITLNS